ncbi:hypothetical protein [Luteolibacter marinus]|uniref:hypothetical protein n=1 Tax=Luteolibacter marinus TaxID=2776705 RepID=UPI001868BCCD|nr:hypothetical protein [Luteolibacter marinus]
MGHQITAEGGSDLAPDAPHVLGAAGGGDLSPTSPGHVAGEGGADLSPAAPFVLGAVGGGDLSPTAPGQETAEFRLPSIAVSGALTKDGATALVFPTLLPAGLRNGRPHWTNTGGHWDGEGGGNYCLTWDESLEYQLITNIGGVFGFSGGQNAGHPFEVATWSPYDGGETGTPVLSTYSPPAAPHTLVPETIY